jgi:hypothetical protein
MSTTNNSDGLIKCLQPTQDKFVTSPKSMLEKSVPFINTVAPGQFRLPGQHLGLAGRRSGALFFALHPVYFAVTRNFAAVCLDLVPSNSFIMTRGYSSIYRDWQKTRHRDADGT